MFVDHARIHCVAGKGGAGCISFRREKFVPKGGPDGGDGGWGGSVVIEVDAHKRTLLDCREQPRWNAQGGKNGSGNNRTGRDGEDLIIKVPPGTLVRDGDSGEVIADLVQAEGRAVVAAGGRGGRGNARFATSTNQAPRRSDPGMPGEERTVELELKLIADVGLVGLPNAGKSTLLSRITRARPKIADYPFTTLEPNLGIVALDLDRTFVVADLPGLIEGASEGRGLGHQFLRHVERTRLLAFVIDCMDESPAATLELLEKELSQYSAAFAEKPRVHLISKADLMPPQERSGAPARLDLPDALVFSAHSGDGLREVLEQMWSLIQSAAPVGGSEDDEG